MSRPQAIASADGIRRFLAWWSQWRTARDRNQAMPWPGRSAADELRAIQLLEDNLASGQREQFDNEGCFDVVGGTTGLRYQIWYGHQLNVQQLDSKGRTLQWLCFVPRGNVPTGDIMLAQKLALELP